MNLRESIETVPPSVVFRGDYARVTAADRPGIAQPVPIRDVPAQSWNSIVIGAVLLFAMLLGSWEWHWRSFGVTPGIRNSDGLWAMQRRRIDAEENDATVAIGASRIYFDLQLDVWQKLDGRRPIQLAFEGTSPVPFLEDLAADPDFHGRLLVGIAPDVFFGAHGAHKQVLEYLRHESPSQRVGQWLSMHVIEPALSFYDEDFALATVLRRQSWPLRPGLREHLQVRKLSMTAADRNTHLWGKVEADPKYRELARTTWKQVIQASSEVPVAKAEETTRKEIEKAAAAVKKLRSRGIDVLFVRMPSSGPYLAFENERYPRARTWEALLAQSGAPGIHFEDYPELREFELPEWSHLGQADAERFTAALYQIVRRDFWKSGSAQRPDEERRVNSGARNE